MNEWLAWLKNANFTMYEMARIELKGLNTHISALEGGIRQYLESDDGSVDERHILTHLADLVSKPKANEGLTQEEPK